MVRSITAQRSHHDRRRRSVCDTVHHTILQDYAPALASMRTRHCCLELWSIVLALVITRDSWRASTPTMSPVIGRKEDPLRVWWWCKAVASRTMVSLRLQTAWDMGMWYKTNDHPSSDSDRADINTKSVFFQLPSARATNYPYVHTADRSVAGHSPR